MKRVWAWIVRIGTLVAVALALLILLPSLLGYERYVIESGSMEPALPVGSVVYSRPVDADDLAVGDIITFKPPPEYGIDQVVTHRVADIQRAPVSTQRPDAGAPEEQSVEPGPKPGAKTRRIFTTKGDANEDPDPWRMTLDNDEAALEKAHLPYLGYVYLALNVTWVRIVVIVIPAIVIAVLTGVALWRAAGEEVEEERARIEREKKEREEAVEEKEPV